MQKLNFLSDQDRLLVKRRKDNHSSGPVIQAYHVIICEFYQFHEISHLRWVAIIDAIAF